MIKTEEQAAPSSSGEADQPSTRHPAGNVTSKSVNDNISSSPRWSEASMAAICSERPSGNKRTIRLFITAFWYWGTATAAKMPIINTTTNNSVKVNPRFMFPPKRSSHKRHYLHSIIKYIKKMRQAPSFPTTKHIKKIFFILPLDISAKSLILCVRQSQAGCRAGPGRILPGRAPLKRRVRRRFGFGRVRMCEPGRRAQDGMFCRRRLTVKCLRVRRSAAVAAGCWSARGEAPEAEVDVSGSAEAEAP